MIKGNYEGKTYSYNGKIESIGEYPSAKVEGDKVWMGKTDFGFIYMCYGGNKEPLCLCTTNAIDIFRFCKPFINIKDSGVTFSKSIEIPEEYHGLIASVANELKSWNKKPVYFNEEFKKMVESL